MNYELYCQGEAECLACHHTWIAIWPLAAMPLVCSECGSTDTVREAHETFED